MLHGHGSHAVFMLASSPVAWLWIEKKKHSDANELIGMGVEWGLLLGDGVWDSLDATCPYRFGLWLD